MKRISCVSKGDQGSRRCWVLARKTIAERAREREKKTQKCCSALSASLLIREEKRSPLLFSISLYLRIYVCVFIKYRYAIF